MVTSTQAMKSGKAALQIGVMVQLSKTDDSGDTKRYLRNLGRRAKYRGYSLMKQVLVDELERHIGSESILIILDGGEPLLSITMECGNSVDYRTFDDIPDVDTPCPCGNPQHWFIKYRDLR